ncbi:MAG TPA: hypothetical protein VGF06_00375 [Terriglobales bacterium]
MLRKIACWMMVFVYPVTLLAADSGAAMLHVRGTTWLNGSAVPQSSAVFPGDLIQTRPDAVANINAAGSSVAILSDSLVKFEGSGLWLDHGALAVATSKRLKAHSGQISVAPASDSWTEFQMSQADGKVQIVARKGDLLITDDSGTSTLAPGQQTTRYAASDSQKGGGAAPAGGGGVLDSPYVMYGGIAAAGALLTWVLVQDGKPFSPSNP